MSGCAGAARLPWQLRARLRARLSPLPPGLGVAEDGTASRAHLQNSGSTKEAVEVGLLQG